MKRRFISTIGLAVMFVLSGCSLLPSGTPASGTVQKFTFSKGILVSRDGGKTWTDSNVSVNKPRVKNVSPLILVFDPVDENIAYLGLRSGGIMKTTNKGESWDFLSLNTEKVYGLAIDPSDTKIIYASTVLNGRGKIFKNTNAGDPEAWNEIYTSATNGPLVVYLALNRKDSKIVYAATSDNQLIKSVDGGTSWRNIFVSKAPIVKIASDVANGNSIYFLTKKGDVLFSRDGGDKIDELAPKISASGLGGSGFSFMEVDSSRSGWIYLGGKAGVIRSKDGGEKWESIATLNKPQNVETLTVNPRNSNEIIYGSFQASYRSVDDGKTWSTSQFDLPANISILKHNPLNPEIMYAIFVGKK